MSTTTISEKYVINIKSRIAGPPHVIPEPKTSVFVIFTSTNRTLKALETAGALAEPSGAGIMAVAVQTVPYPLPLDEPPVPFEFIMKRFEERTREFPESLKVSAYLCRDPLEALKRVLSADSTVVIGIRKRWWPTRDERLGRKLRRAGYRVVLVETE